MSSLKHRVEIPQQPERVVLLGSNGVIGKNLRKLLELKKIPTLSLSRQQLDLTNAHAHAQLALLLRPTDAVVFLATLTPDKGKGIDTFMKNLLMVETGCKAFVTVKPAHLVYLSSDTLYSLYRGIVSEESPTDPENLFGVMHLARESMLKASLSFPLAFLRSTLIYGADDTHNSYGPNRLRRMAHKEKKITLFGKGEERRDHIYIRDVVELIFLTLFYRSEGVLNLVTGQSISYWDLAHKIGALFPHPIEVLSTPRATPVTHRHFDPTAIYKAFPSFSFTPLDQGLEETHRQEFQNIPFAEVKK